MISDPDSPISVISRMRDADPYVRLAAMGIESLTPRETEIARYLTDGYTNAQIADTLCIGERTVDAHVTAIFSKLGAVNRTHAAVLYRLYAIRAYVDDQIVQMQEAVAAIAADPEFM